MMPSRGPVVLSPNSCPSPSAKRRTDRFSKIGEIKKFLLVRQRAGRKGTKAAAIRAAATLFFCVAFIQVQIKMELSFFRFLIANAHVSSCKTNFNLSVSQPCPKHDPNFVFKAIKQIQIQATGFLKITAKRALKVPFLKTHSQSLFQDLFKEPKYNFFMT